MNHTAARPSGRARAIGATGVLSLAILSGTAGVVRAASVTPLPINEGNPTCADFGSWQEVKAEPPADGTYSNGTLTVTISNFVPSSSGQPGSFDWSSNIGVDAVFVKAGNTKHNLYVYDPESTADTALMPQAGTGNGISHISFCYDTGDPTTPPTTPPSSSPSATPTNPPSATPASSPSGGVLSAVSTPALTLPPTDASSVAAPAGPASAPIGSLTAILGVLGAVSILAIGRPRGARR